MLLPSGPPGLLNGSEVPHSRPSAPVPGGGRPSAGVKFLDRADPAPHDQGAPAATGSCRPGAVAPGTSGERQRCLTADIPPRLRPESFNRGFLPRGLSAACPLVLGRAPRRPRLGASDNPYQKRTRESGKFRGRSAIFGRPTMPLGVTFEPTDPRR